MTSETHFTRGPAALALLLMLAVASATVSGWHFALVRSVPAADATLDVSPGKLQLWFSQVPAVGVSQLKLGVAGDDKSVIEVGKTAVDAKEKSLTATVTQPLAAGAYVIRWRGAGDDGHVMAGEITFVVAPKPPQLGR